MEEKNRLNFGPKLINDIDEYSIKSARQSFPSFKNQPLYHCSQEKVVELYSKAVGEMGIAPTDFFYMSEEEIDWAYEGYLKRKELEANVIQLAVARALAGETELITLLEPKEYSVGSEEERVNVFKNLGNYEEETHE